MLRVLQEKAVVAIVGAMIRAVLRWTRSQFNSVALSDLVVALRFKSRNFFKRLQMSMSVATLSQISVILFPFSTNKVTIGIVCQNEQNTVAS